jgi:hypothetical protein
LPPILHQLADRLACLQRSLQEHGALKTTRIHLAMRQVRIQPSPACGVLHRLKHRNPPRTASEQNPPPCQRFESQRTSMAAVDLHEGASPDHTGRACPAPTAFIYCRQAARSVVETQARPDRLGIASVAYTLRSLPKRGHQCPAGGRAVMLYRA